ncbi:hypothetical protein EDD17DRAFT_1889696 [Pisolithus thermaeus]|nr:hypothetical protein EDD17DRAFT_1889696 [Pisolithus thermaeus]
MRRKATTLSLASTWLISVFSTTVSARTGNVTWRADSATPALSLYDLSSTTFSDSKDKCPPCFNCLLPAFTCGQFGRCNEYNGQCKCPPGWGGIDCLIPQCDSLADGDHRTLRGDKPCECKDGWAGINCNVCKTDAACAGFPLSGGARAEIDDGTAVNLTCYKGGETVFNNHQMCDITNRKILDMLPGRPPQVTFSCDNATGIFYCALDACTSQKKAGYDADTITYACEHIKCKCIPGRFLCGEDGSVDISDFLVEEIRGPGKFSCRTGGGCRFEEPAMNQLINDIFGDAYITLNCEGGECLHYRKVPGYQRPTKPDNTKWVALSSAAAGLIFILALAGLWYVGHTRPNSFGGGPIHLPHDSSHPEHVPATLHFSSISYTIPNGQVILKDVRGVARPGSLTAIMGASGSEGTVSGTVLLNGRPVSPGEMSRVSGYVDQEDTLMGTLTVFETVLYSALLRLPRSMSEAEKIARVMGTLQELGIAGIAGKRIGGSGKRSISGGEKRRVSIACELVTSPSILFLDEPTSGLDAYNAQSVIEALTNLARTYNRTVVLTIHQPRSGIVALFDELILLARGRCVWSGPMHRDWLGSIGKGCPIGFNMADYLITPSHIEENSADEERALLSTSDADETELQTRVSSASQNSRRLSVSSAVRRKTSQMLDVVRRARDEGGSANIPEKLADLAKAMRADFDSIYRMHGFPDEVPSNGTVDALGERTDMHEMRDVAAETNMLRGRQRASWGTQFRILSGRAFKNLYRDPALLTAHYASSVALALICGLFFHNVSNDIAGFQNRLGIFFFTLALFGFSCLSSLGLFANERILFMRERANGYYSTFTYFASKVLFDILPLRLVPPLVYGGIVYGLVGLVPTVPAFWKFMLTLVLFNLTTASVILLLSISFESTSVGSLVGTLIMLFNLLFTGLLVNRETVTPALQWLHTISFFHAAFEALAVNELRYLQLKEIKYGVELDVPAATILSIFGLRAQSFWWPNISLLAIFFVTLTTGSYFMLHFFVKKNVVVKVSDSHTDRFVPGSVGNTVCIIYDLVAAFEKDDRTH